MIIIIVVVVFRNIKSNDNNNNNNNDDDKDDDDDEENDGDKRRSSGFVCLLVFVCLFVFYDRESRAAQQSHRVDALKDEEPSIENMNTVLREAMDTIQNQTQKSTIEKSIEDTEIENLDKKRKELRQNTNKKLKDKVEYAELNK